MNIFVTGGAGYIGSHTCVELIKAGHQVVVYDNLSNAHPEVLNRIEKITGQKVSFIKGDVRDRQLMEESLRAHGCEAVFHFAGLKAVGESIEKPLAYYDNNVTGTIHVLEAMLAAKTRFIIFSSSATVYGLPETLPLTETHPLSVVNPYGHTKLISEGILESFVKANPFHCAGILRYFNPVGAHESGLIGEDPKGIPNNLFPYVSQTAAGRRDCISIWGNDYENTPDGTGVRDYVHVVDLAKGHVHALKKLMESQTNFVVNLGTGSGYSVLEILHAFEQACGHKIPYKFGPRRQGDVATYYADPSQAQKLLNWVAQKDLAQMCKDTWNWQTKNPDGYRHSS
ncbi:MAG: UDP-glucose 4-epimerase GalE [Alphaproteobacteria bacterium]|nr:UDP-glucose 4-epimerase GalE [Alphaproteobacteria bacterium]